MHAQIWAIIDGHDTVLGRVKLQANATIDVVAEAVYVCEVLGTICICGKAIRSIMKSAK